MDNLVIALIIFGLLILLSLSSALGWWIYTSQDETTTNTQGKETENSQNKASVQTEKSNTANITDNQRNDNQSDNQVSNNQNQYLDQAQAQDQGQKGGTSTIKEVITDQDELGKTTNEATSTHIGHGIHQIDPIYGDVTASRPDIGMYGGFPGL
jgi:Sec-independent protein translocase protein TatA